jgi:murein DD-endopeptidase MepM/ murein hydrolase activator NlpD
MIRLLYLFALSAMLFFVGACNQATETAERQEAPEKIDPLPAPKNLNFGFNFDEYIVKEGTIERNTYLSDILLKHNIPYQKIDQLVNESKETFDVRKINAGKDYVILCSKEDSLETCEYFIYKQDPVNYVVFSLADSVYAYRDQKAVETRMREASGVIHSSLYQTMQENDLSPALTMELSNMYAWTIDFYRIQPGDQFTVKFEEKVVEDQVVGVGKIVSANFRHQGEDYYSFYYEQDSIGDYFDEEGNSLKKAFLKAPLKFSRISSRYTKKRFHPVLKRYKSHLGTDYAAAHGTPIVAVGDGQVIASSYTSGNGKYVKIRHNSTYTTQYLHMSRRAVKNGQRVKQGDVIGYVGSTGLATGPHVCFRFWKNGRQVDHLREKFPPSKPIKPENKPEFEKVMQKEKEALDQIVVDTVEELAENEQAAKPQGNS